MKCLKSIPRRLRSSWRPLSTLSNAHPNPVKVRSPIAGAGPRREGRCNSQPMSESIRRLTAVDPTDSSGQRRVFVGMSETSFNAMQKRWQHYLQDREALRKPYQAIEKIVLDEFCSDVENLNFMAKQFNEFKLLNGEMNVDTIRKTVADLNLADFVFLSYSAALSGIEGDAEEHMRALGLSFEQLFKPVMQNLMYLFILDDLLELHNPHTVQATADAMRHGDAYPAEVKSMEKYYLQQILPEAERSLGRQTDMLMMGWHTFISGVADSNRFYLQSPATWTEADYISCRGQEVAGDFLFTMAAVTVPGLHLSEEQFTQLMTHPSVWSWAGVIVGAANDCLKEDKEKCAAHDFSQRWQSLREEDRTDELRTAYEMALNRTRWCQQFGTVDMVSRGWQQLDALRMRHEHVNCGQDEMMKQLEEIGVRCAESVIFWYLVATRYQNAPLVQI